MQNFSSVLPIFEYVLGNVRGSFYCTTLGLQGILELLQPQHILLLQEQQFLITNFRLCSLEHFYIRSCPRFLILQFWWCCFQDVLLIDALN